MDSADQAMELQDFQSYWPNPHDFLFEYLRHKNYEAFKSLAMKGLRNNPPNIDIDHVLQQPLYKTVLDVASADGFEEFVELILDLGANPNKENADHRRSPLHFAAEAGNFGVLKILLNHPAIKPDLEVAGETALHLAVSNKNVECVQVLMDHNANPNIANEKGLTPTHLAAMSRQEEIVGLIISKADVRCVDNEGNTALHYAARTESSEIISMLLKAGSYIGHENALGIAPIANIAPETMSRYLDDCLQPKKEYSENFEDYEIEFNYQCLVPLGITSNLNNEESLLENGAFDDDNICMEMQPFLNIATSNSHRHLLKHPILSSFLYLKWQRLSPILYANFIFYFIFYLLLNSYIISMTYTTEGVKENGANTTVNQSIDNITSQLLTAGWNKPSNGLWYSTAIALVILVLREMLQLISSPRDYFLNSENWLELLLICFGIALLRGAGASVGALAILLSAWELIILIGQHPRMSTSIEMFKTVTRNFIHFFFLYALLILAFALAFYTLFKDGDESSFLNPGHSLFKTIIMLTGEFDTDGIPFVNHPILSHLVFVLFVFLIAIVLFNLLNGLAVSNTAEILGKAELVGLISRTKLVAYAESIFVGSLILKKRWCHSSGFIQRMKIYPFRFLAKNMLFFPHVLPDAKIRVKPLRSNAVLSRGKVIAKNTCSKLTMDRHIITHAKEIISRRGRVSDHQKILNTVNQKFDEIVALIRNFNRLQPT